MSNLYLSQQADIRFKTYLESQGHLIISVKPTRCVYAAVASHPDIYMCKLGVSADAPVVFSQEFQTGVPSEIGFSYPENIRYNAACAGPYFIHNLKFTAPRLLAAAQRLGLTPVPVRQGYTKCNLILVDEHSAITSDAGIAGKLDSRMDILLIAPGHVALPGFPCGFLGGASGRILHPCGRTEILFNGNLQAHPDFLRICRFIEERGLSVRYFPEYALTDIGSVIQEATYEETCDYSHIHPARGLSE